MMKLFGQRQLFSIGLGNALSDCGCKEAFIHTDRNLVRTGDENGEKEKHTC